MNLSFTVIASGSSTLLRDSVKAGRWRPTDATDPRTRSKVVWE